MGLSGSRPKSLLRVVKFNIYLVNSCLYLHLVLYTNINTYVTFLSHDISAYCSDQQIGNMRDLLFINRYQQTYLTHISQHVPVDLATWCMYRNDHLGNVGMATFGDLIYACAEFAYCPGPLACQIIIRPRYAVKRYICVQQLAFNNVLFPDTRLGLNLVTQHQHKQTSYDWTAVSADLNHRGWSGCNRR
jgi:hypothetical protein